MKIKKIPLPVGDILFEIESIEFENMPPLMFSFYKNLKDVQFYKKVIDFISNNFENIHKIGYVLFRMDGSTEIVNLDKSRWSIKKGQ